LLLKTIEMKYQAKSAIIGRKGKRDEEGSSPVFVNLFKINDPHKTSEVPIKFLDYKKIHKINIKKLSLSYLIEGSDILINDLKWIDVKSKEGHLDILGEQKK
jgi:hypothetical protein